MRQGRVRHRFDILHFEHPEIGLPRVEPEQWIVIRTEVFRYGLLSNRLMEHSAQRHAIDGSGVNTKSNDSAGELVHDDEHPNCNKTWSRLGLCLELAIRHGHVSSTAEFRNDCP